MNSTFRWCLKLTAIFSIYVSLFGCAGKESSDQESEENVVQKKIEILEIQIETPEEQFIRLSNEEQIKVFEENIDTLIALGKIDLREMATTTYNGPWGKTLRSGFERAIKEKGWLNLEGDELIEQYKRLAEGWYDLIVNKGMGKFVDKPMPPQFKEYYENFYELLMADFNDTLEILRPGFTERLAP